MIAIYLAAAIALVAAGAMIGVIAIVAIGIHADERAFRRAVADAKKQMILGVGSLSSKVNYDHLEKPSTNHRENVRL